MTYDIEFPTIINESEGKLKMRLTSYEDILDSFSTTVTTVAESVSQSVAHI